MAVTELDGLTRETDDPFDVAFFRVVRIPKNDNIASLKVSPADAPDLVINQLVDQQALAVMS